MNRSIRHPAPRILALACAALLPLSVAACSRQPAANEDTAAAEAEQPAVEETATQPAAEEPAEPGADELAAREAEVDAAEQELSRREELLQREAEVARREAEVARRERAALQGTQSAPPVAQPEPQPEPAPVVAEEPEPTPAPARELVDVSVPAGTLVDVEFLDGVSSETSQVGETFTTRVASPVSVDGVVAIPAGARVTGVVTEAVPLKKIGGRARLALELDRLVLPGGAEIPISAGLAEAGRSETGKDAATIGGAAAAGAILGRATASRGDRKKATIIGTILGGAAGAVIASKTEGEEITIPEGTFVTIALDTPVRLRVER